MIVFGKVVPLEKAAKLCFEGIPEEFIDKKIHSVDQTVEKVSCCDCGFRHGNEEYLLGYNPLIQVSNFRAIIDSMKDVAIFTLFILYLQGRVKELYWIGLPHIVNDILMIIDILSLKRYGHAEFIDVLGTFLSAILEVGYNYKLNVFNGFRTKSEYVITGLWAYLILQVFLFLITRLYQKRYNKNIGVCLIKIAFIAQLIIFVHFERHRAIDKNSHPLSLIYHLFILLGLSGFGSLLTIGQILMILKKIFTCDRIGTRISLSSFN